MVARIKIFSTFKTDDSFINDVSLNSVEIKYTHIKKINKNSPTSNFTPKNINLQIKSFIH